MKQVTLVSIFVLAVAASAPAFSQGYVGLAGGASRIEQGCATGQSCDKNDGAIKVYGGYSLGNDFSAELSYYSLGTFKNSTTAGGAVASDSVKGSYWGLGGAWRPQFGNGWGGVGRLGAADTEGKTSAGSFGSQTYDSWHPYAGLGVTYEIAKNIRLEADYDYTRLGAKFTDPTTGTATKSTNGVSTYMLGATYAF